MNEIHSTTPHIGRDAPVRHGFVRTLLLMLLMFLLTAMMTSRGGIPSDTIRLRPGG